MSALPAAQVGRFRRVALSLAIAALAALLPAAPAVAAGSEQAAPRRNLSLVLSGATAGRAVVCGRVRRALVATPGQRLAAAVRLRGRGAQRRTRRVVVTVDRCEGRRARRALRRSV